MTYKEKLFYYLCEAVQSRYSDQKIALFVDPKVQEEKRQLRRELLDFVHFLEEREPKWMQVVDFKIGDDYTFSAKDFDKNKANMVGAKEGDDVVAFFMRKEDLEEAKTNWGKESIKKMAMREFEERGRWLEKWFMGVGHKKKEE